MIDFLHLLCYLPYQQALSYFIVSSLNVAFAVIVFFLFLFMLTLFHINGTLHGLTLLRRSNVDSFLTVNFQSKLHSVTYFGIYVNKKIFNCKFLCLTSVKISAIINKLICGDAGIGRQASLRCLCQYWRVGSSPISRTSVKDIRFFECPLFLYPAKKRKL